MAKKENFDFDDWDDFDDFSDFEDGNGIGGFKSTNRVGKAREAVTALTGGLVSGVKRNLFSRNFYQTLTANALPREYSTALDKSLESADAISDIYDTAKREASTTNDKLTKGVKPVVDKYGDKLPKRMQRPIREWTRNVRSTSEWTPENKDELETVAALNDIFNKREQTKSAKNTSIQSQVQTGIAQTNMSLTAQMLNNQKQALAYQDQVDATWKRKSIEIQYKQLFVQRKLLDVTEQSLALDRKSYEDIVKNTGLPDMVKAEKSELASRMVSEKIYGAAIERFSSLPYNVLQSTANNITKKIRGGGAELREMLGDVFDNLDENIEEGSDIAGTVGPLGGLRMGGDMAGDGVSGYIAKLIGKRVAKRLGDNGRVKHGADFISGNMKRLPRIFGDMVKNEDTGSDFLDMILELTDMKSQMTSNNGLVSRNTSGSLDTQVYFDLLTKKSITEIIPGYLTRIHHELRSLRTGDDSHPFVNYDFDKNVFSNDTVIASRLKEKVVGNRNKAVVRDAHENIIKELGLNGSETESGLPPEIRDLFLKELTKASLNNSDFTLKTLLNEETTPFDDIQRNIFEDFVRDKFGVEEDLDIPGQSFTKKVKGKIGNYKNQTAKAAAAQRTITESLETLHDYLSNPSGALNSAVRKGQLSQAMDTGIVDENGGTYSVNYDRFIEALMDGTVDDDYKPEEKEEKKKTATRRFFNNRTRDITDRYKNSNIRERGRRISTRYQNRILGRPDDAPIDDDNTASPPSDTPPTTNEVNNFKRTFKETRLTNMHSKYGSNDKVITAIEYAKEQTKKDDVSTSDLQRIYAESKPFRDLVNDAIESTKTKANEAKNKFGSFQQTASANAKTQFNTAFNQAKTHYDDAFNQAKGKYNNTFGQNKKETESKEYAEAQAEAEQIIIDNNIEDETGELKESLASRIFKNRFKKGSRAHSDFNSVKDVAADIKTAATRTANNVKSKSLNPNVVSAVKLLFELGKYTAKAGAVLTKPHRNALKLIPFGVKKLMSAAIDVVNFKHVEHGLWLRGEAEPRMTRTGLDAGRYLNGKGDVIEKPSDIKGNVYDAMSTPAKLIMTPSEYRSGLYDSSGKLIYKPPGIIAKTRNAIWGLAKKATVGATRMLGKGIMGYLNITTKPANWIINRILREDRIDPKLHAELVQLGLTQQTNQKIDELAQAVRGDEDKKYNDADGDGKRDGNADDVRSSRQKKRDEAKKAKEADNEKKGLLSRLFGDRKNKKKDDEDGGFDLMGMIGKGKGLGRLAGLARNPYVLGALAAAGVVSWEAIRDGQKTEDPDDIANLALPEGLKDSKTARIGVRITDTIVDKLILGNVRNSAKAATKVGEWGLRASKWFSRKKEKLDSAFKNQLNMLGGNVAGLLFGKGARKFVDKLLNVDNVNPLFRFRMAQYGFKFNDKQAVEAILKFEDDILKTLIPANDKQPARIADSITIEQSAAYFDVSINDEDDLTEWVAWYTNRFRPVFLSAVTAMQRLGYDSKKFHEIDSMLSKKHKLEFISKSNFWRDETNPYDADVNPLPTEWRLDFGDHASVNDAYKENLTVIEEMSDDESVVKEDQARVKKRENKALDKAKAKHAGTKPSTRFDPYAMIDKLNTKDIIKSFKSKSVNDIKDKKTDKTSGEGGEFGGAGAGGSFGPTVANNSISENGIFGAALIGVGNFMSKAFMKEAHASTFIPEMQYGGASAPMGKGSKASVAAGLVGGSPIVSKFSGNKADGTRSFRAADKPLKASEHARLIARPSSNGYAAKHMKEALMKAGYQFKAPAYPKDYPAQVLPSIGFVEIKKSVPHQAGDIIVFGATSEFKGGHIQIFDGANWISDFVQESYSPYLTNTPSYTVWRDKQFQANGSLSTRESKQKDELGNIIKDAGIQSKAKNDTKPKPKEKEAGKSTWDKIKDLTSKGKEAITGFFNGVKDKVSSGVDAVGGFTTKVKDKLSNTLASMTGSQKEWQLCVYKAFKTAGFSEQQARILTAEIGRENSYNPKYMFAGHADPHSGSNLGMLSWQGDRKPRLVNFLKQSKVLDRSNNMVPGQEALDAQAKFIMWEMRNTHKSVGSQFLAKPNISYEEGAYMIGKRYILWRIDDPKYAPSGKKNRDGFYNMLLKQLAGGSIDTKSKDSPATKSTLAKAGGVVSNAYGAAKSAISSINPFSGDDNVDPKATTDNGGGGGGTATTLPANSAPVIAAQYARKKAAGKSLGKCARYVRVALQHAGYKFTPNPSAYQYASGTLSGAGFGQISTNTPYQVGDIIVIGRSAKHIHGHICIWDGKNWISDFVQRKWNPYSTPQSYTLWRDRNYLNGASASSGPTNSSGSDSTVSQSGTYGEASSGTSSYNPVSMKYNDYSGVDEKIKNSWEGKVTSKTVPKTTEDSVPTNTKKVSDPDKTVVKTKKSDDIAKKVNASANNVSPSKLSSSLVNNFVPADGVSSKVDTEAKDEAIAKEANKTLTQRMSEVETKRANEAMFEQNGVLQESLRVQRKMLEKLDSLDRHLLEISKGQRSRNVVESSPNATTTNQPNKPSTVKPVHNVERAGRNEPMSMSKMI